jgi:hypothetical protein
MEKVFFLIIYKATCSELLIFFNKVICYFLIMLVALTFNCVNAQVL